MKILYGKPVADKIVSGLTNLNNAKVLIIQIGDNPSSNVYVRNKMKKMDSLGIKCTLAKYDAINMDTICSVAELIHKYKGVFLQLPTGNPLGERLIMNMIRPDQDIDGLLDQSQGKLFSTTNKDYDSYLVPCTARAVLHILNYYDIDVSGKVVGVIGRSKLVGKPLTPLLTKLDATVISMHTKTPNIEELSKQCDILVVAAGSPKLVNKDWVKPGATIIDVGINSIDGKFVGDVDFEDVKDVVGAITPVPKGVGPVTVANLMQNISIVTGEEA